MRARSPWLLGALILTLTVVGCDGQPESSGSGTPPAHPAMQGAASKGGNSSGALLERPALPPDHPPIDSMPAEARISPARPAPVGAGGGAGAGGLADRLSRLGIALTLPKGWVEEAPSSAMRLGQVRLPRVEGDSEDGELSIIPAKGTVEDNIKRWSGQFTEKPAPVQAQRDVSGFQVTMVEMEGSFTGAGGPMMKSAAPKPGTKLVGAIVRLQGDEDLLFFKAWGPKATMEKWRPSFDELVASFRPAK